MLHFILKPNEQHLEEIKSWLIEHKSGFYYEWNFIYDSFKRGKITVIAKNNCAIGFMVYRIHELYAVIDIIEVSQFERKKGVAKFLINESLNFFKKKGVLVAELYCSPVDSEPFWRKMGFIKFPYLYPDTRIRLYKPLVKTLITTEDLILKSSISLWNCESYQATNKNVKWKWDLPLKDDNLTLMHPIIFPVAGGWKIELVKDGKTTFSKQIKKLPNEAIDNGDFLIIKKLWD